MRSLFFKIFFCFVVIIILVGTSLETSTFFARYYEERWQGVLHSIMPMEAEKSARMFEDSGKEAVQTYLDDLQRQKTVRFYFFDENGISLLDRSAPKPVLAIVTNKEGMLRTSRENLSSVLVRQGIAARLVTGPSGRSYILAFQTSPTQLVPFSAAIGGHPYLRLLVISLFGIVLCLILTRHITKPLAELRQAASGIAAGQLKTRISPALLRRHDEIAVLGQDFDRMAEQIETLVTAQRNLLGDVSHELRSPLARLIVALSLLRHGPAEEANEYQNRIGLEADRLDKLIGQLLTLTRIDSGVDSNLMETFDLTDLVQEVAADGDFEGRPHDRGVKVVSADECRMEGISELVRSAIENVVRNAVRHTRAGTTVEIDVERYDGPPGPGNQKLNKLEELKQPMARLRVRDFGNGIPEPMLGEIFLPFYRANHMTAGPQSVVPAPPDSKLQGRRNGEAVPEEKSELPTNGAGLGLAIAERVVRMHLGSIHAHNAIGGGLVVEIQLPLI